MSDERDALATVIHAAWEADNRVHTMREYAQIAADAVLAVPPPGGADTQEPTERHDLIISLGDEEFWGRCSCGAERETPLRSDQSFDDFALWWERHVMVEVAHEYP